MRETDADTSWQAPRGNVNQQMRWTRKRQRKAFLIGCSPSQKNLEDLATHVPAHSSERESSGSEGDAWKVVTEKRKHGIYTHFPKDRHCDICKRTKITRFPCRRHNEGSIPRAEHFGDLITADHKIFNEGSESWNNHQYAVVVQDLATHLIQSYSCKNQNSLETQKSLRKNLEPSQKPKVIYTDSSSEFGKSCQELSWYHRTSAPYRSQTNGIAERAVRREKKEHELYYCIPDQMISGGQIPWNAIAICEMSKTFWQTGKLEVNEDLVNLSKDQKTPRETKREFINSEREFCQESF